MNKIDKDLETKIENNDEELATKTKKLEKSEKQNKTKNKIIIILIIIILLLLCVLGYRIGKIGYTVKETTGPVGTTGTDENIDAIRITSEGITWGEDTRLNIFNNEKFNDEKIIAPRSSGTYKFYVKNELKDNINYTINVLDDMSNFVNMKYKLKLNNVYVCGNENTYVTIDELNLDDIILTQDSTSLYTLEWYWDDDDERDTYIGSLKTDEYYTLGLKINAEKLEY